MFNSKKSETPANIIFDDTARKANAQKKINKHLTKFVIVRFVVPIAAVAVATYVGKKLDEKDSSEN